MDTSRLKNIRVARRISQQKLAAIMGVRQSTVSKWEKRVPPERVPALCEVLGCDGHALRPDLYRAPDRPPRDIHADVSGVPGDV